MNSKQVAAALEASVQDRYKAWTDHCQQTIQGYDKLDPRLLSRVNQDLCDLLCLVETLQHRREQDVQDATARERQRCCGAVLTYCQVSGIENAVAGVTDALMVVLSPAKAAEAAKVVLPNFGPVEVGGYSSVAEDDGEY